MKRKRGRKSRLYSRRSLTRVALGHISFLQSGKAVAATKATRRISSTSLKGSFKSYTWGQRMSEWHFFNGAVAYLSACLEGRYWPGQSASVFAGTIPHSASSGNGSPSLYTHECVRSQITARLSHISTSGRW